MKEGQTTGVGVKIKRQWNNWLEIGENVNLLRHEGAQLVSRRR